VVEAAMVSCAESELLEHAVKKRPADSERKSEPIVIFFLQFSIIGLSSWGFLKI